MYALALCAAILLQCPEMSSACGSTLKGLGLIRSPNYPEAYSDRENCSWTLEASPPHGNIVLEVTYFNTETCCDIVSINSSSGSLAYRFAGKQDPTIIVLGNSAVINFTSDGSVVRSGFEIRFTTSVTADFSRYSLSVNTACDLLLAKLSVRTDFERSLQPSFVSFSIKPIGSDKIVTQRIAANSSNMSVSFLVDPNTTYNVWATPETCLPKKLCGTRLTSECFNSTYCFGGRDTAVATVTTTVQEYELTKRGNIVSVKNKSPQKCDALQRINENTSVIMAAIIGGSVCFVFLVVAITTGVILKRRFELRSLKSSCCNTKLDVNSLKMDAHQEAEADGEIYANIDSEFNDSQGVQCRYTDRPMFHAQSRTVTQ